ncbi:ulp1 protease family, C-terminal catalytic domain-containing protein [Tanacetum coccineum]
MCKGVNNNSGVKVDDYGFTLVDLGTNGYASEPFILAKQATQVFFVQDPSNPRWHVVMPGKWHILGVDNVVDEDEYD